MTFLRRDARQSRQAFLATVLAVVAVFGLIALSGWHNAVIHDDDTIHVTSIEHRHTPSRQADPDAPIHLLAHAVGQWITTAGSFATPAGAVLASRNWAPLEACLRHGIDPAALLRPPRS